MESSWRALARGKAAQLGLAGLLGCAGAHAELYVWSGDVDGHYAFAQATYTTREISLSSDLTLPLPHSELDGEFRFDREYIQIKGTPLEVNTDKYDAILKYKYFLDDTPYYLYVSPRMRYDRFGFYQKAQSIRSGAGRKFGSSTALEYNLELGTGYREAMLAGQGEVSEILYIASIKGRWNASETVSVKLNWVNEWSSRESYTTLTLGVRNKLTDKLGLKYELLYRRAFPFDSQEKDGEWLSEVGLSYSF